MALTRRKFLQFTGCTAVSLCLPDISYSEDTLHVVRKVGKEDAKCLEALLSPGKSTGFEDMSFPELVFVKQNDINYAGRCIALDSNGFFITSMHVLSNYEKSGDVWEELKNMKLVPDSCLSFYDPQYSVFSHGKVLAADASCDLALGKLDACYEGNAALAIEEHPVKQCEELSVALYQSTAQVKMVLHSLGENGRPPGFMELEPRIKKANVMRDFIVEPSTIGPGVEYMIELKGMHEGDSGTPIYNSFGRLVGICGYRSRIAAINTDFAGVVSNLRIRKFIESYLDRC